MRKSIQKLVMASAVVAAMSTSAFAGLSPATGVKSIAAELFPSAATLTVSSGNSDYLQYSATGNFNPNDVLTFTFANAVVNSGTLVLCASNTTNVLAADLISSADTTNGLSQVQFRFSTTLPGGSVVYLAQACNNGSAPDPLSYKLTAALSSGSTVTVSTQAGFGGSTNNLPFAVQSGTVYSVTKQFSMVAPNGVATSTLDFSTGFKTFGGTNVLAGSVGAGTLVENVPAVSVPNTAASVVLLISGNMAGVSSITAGGAATFTINAGSNTATYTYAATPAANKLISFNFGGNIGLSARTYTIAANLTTKSAGSAIFPLYGATNFAILQLNSTTLYIPLVKGLSATTTDTFIKMSSKNTTSGANGVTISAYGTRSTPTQLIVTGGMTAGNTTVIRATDIISFVKTGACANSGCGLAYATGETGAANTVDETNGFPIIIAVNTPTEDVFCYAAQTDTVAGNAKRIPVQTLTNLNNTGLASATGINIKSE